jgi:hypothetical protein
MTTEKWTNFPKTVNYAKQRAKALLKKLKIDNPNIRLKDAQDLLAKTYGCTDWQKFMHVIKKA